MTPKELEDKIGAMHQRFLDNPKLYAEFVKLLLDYKESSSPSLYDQDVTSALRNGLENVERYLKMDMALSPRSIIIEKRCPDESQTFSKADTEGDYQIFFIMDDESRLHLHPDRKQSHLLYILMLLCSLKHGLLADLFLIKNHEGIPALKTVVKLITLIYPHLNENDKNTMQMAKDLAPNHSFSNIFQKMKAPVTDCLKQAGLSDDLYWYMPYADEKIKKKKKINLYKMHMPQPRIHFPPEFQAIIDELPDAADYLAQKGINIDDWGKDMENDFALCQEAAKRGDAEGLYNLGLHYSTGEGVRQDYKKSVAFLQKADKNNYFEATYTLGVYHMFGFGVKQNIYKALDYFERAAKSGHAEAAEYAAQIYERGTCGVKVNHQKAFNLYMIAAEQDYEEAMWYVIDSYLSGNGTKRDVLKAVTWFMKADKLGFQKIDLLFGIYLFNLNKKETLDYANDLFVKAADADIPQAYYFMALMVSKGYAQTDNLEEEKKTWLLKGADLGDNYCIKTIKHDYPEVYEENKCKWNRLISIYDLLKECLSEMDQLKKEEFIQLIDAYRERWHASYLTEICKQLSIHKAHDTTGNNLPTERQIIVRKSKGGKLPYELVFRLANGEEVIINKINPNSLMLYLLAVICSYKSGYTTLMAKSKDCRPILKEFVLLVCGDSVGNLDYYIDCYMISGSGQNENKYRQYSNIAKRTIRDAIGTKDEVLFFLFNNRLVLGKQNLRQTILDSQYIEIPQELISIAQRMPDALDILKSANIHQDTTQSFE